MGKIKKAISFKSPSSKKEKSTEKSKVKKLGKNTKTHAVQIAKINRKLICKKDKKKAKKQKVLDGIMQTKKKFAEEKATKRRQKTAIVGDLRPLLDSLPSLDELITIRDKSKKTGIAAIDQKKNQRKPRNKYEKRNMLTNIKTEKYLDRFDHMQKMWKDPAFQKNPRELIAEQIKQRRFLNEN